MVPEWYLKAFRNGVSKEKRREMVREFCLKDAQARAARRGEPVPESLDERAMALTYEMFEHALGLGGAS